VPLFANANDRTCLSHGWNEQWSVKQSSTLQLMTYVAEFLETCVQCYQTAWRCNIERKNLYSQLLQNLTLRLFTVQIGNNGLIYISPLKWTENNPILSLVSTAPLLWTLATTLCDVALPVRYRAERINPWQTLHVALPARRRGNCNTIFYLLRKPLASLRAIFRKAQLNYWKPP
jgi:hypothetical protein